MKRADLIRKIKDSGCIMIRHEARHYWYQNPGTRISQPVPRHNEINDYLARHIIRMLTGMK